MSELIDRQDVIDRLKKAEDVFRQNGAKLEANGIHYALELVESDIEIPTVSPFEPDYVGAERLEARQRGYEDGYRNGMAIGKTLNPKIKQGGTDNDKQKGY